MLVLQWLRVCVWYEEVGQQLVWWKDRPLFCLRYLDTQVKWEHDFIFRQMTHWKRLGYCTELVDITSVSVTSVRLINPTGSIQLKGSELHQNRILTTAVWSRLHHMREWRGVIGLKSSLDHLLLLLTNRAESEPVWHHLSPHLWCGSKRETYTPHYELLMWSIHNSTHACNYVYNI